MHRVDKKFIFYILLAGFVINAVSMHIMGRITALPIPDSYIEYFIDNRALGLFLKNIFESIVGVGLIASITVFMMLKVTNYQWFTISIGILIVVYFNSFILIPLVYGYSESVSYFDYEWWMRGFEIVLIISVLLTAYLGKSFNHKSISTADDGDKM